MKRKYNLYDLYVMTVKCDNNSYIKLICELEIGLTANILYKEVFTNKKINTADENVVKVEMLFDYYPPMSLINSGNFKISKNNLLNDYNKINKMGTLLNHTDGIIEKEAKENGIFKNSKVYKKKYR